MHFIDGFENSIRIIAQKIAKAELQQIAESTFGDLVKAVVDIDKKIMALGGELHADEEAVLIQNGSRQADLWGINLYPAQSDSQFIEFDSMINIKPSNGNKSRAVEDENIRRRIVETVRELIE